MKRVVDNWWVWTLKDDVSWYDLLSEDMHDSSFKGGVVYSNMDKLMHNIENKGKYRLKFLDQIIFDYCEGMVFPKFHYLYTSFNEKIQQLVTGGFFEHWLEKWTKHRFNTEKPPPAGPENLNLDQLSIGFVIWLIALAISLTAFIGELLRYWGPKIYHLIIFEQILKAFLKAHRNIC